MATNSELLRKADLTLTDLQTNGGYLPAEEGARFVRKLIKAANLLQQIRVVEMTSPVRKINKIGFSKRILRRAQSATALTAAQRSKPDTEQIQLVSKEQIAEVRLPYDVLEDSIERAEAANNEASNTGPGGLRQTLIDLIAERAAVDMEELAILGDTAYVNASDADDQAYLRQLDGFLKKGLTEGHLVDANNTAPTKAMFREAMKAMPDQYLRNRASMRHYVSVDSEIDYRDSLADRATGLGDSMTTGSAAAMAYGVPVQPIEMMPNDRGLFTNPLNLIMGIQRQVSMEFDKDITSRVYIIVLTTRIDFQVEEIEALVAYDNVASL